MNNSDNKTKLNEETSQVSELDAPCLPPKTLMARIAFPFAALLFLIILIVFEIMQIVGGVFGKTGLRISGEILQRGFIYYLYVLGARIDLKVPTELEKDKAYIFVSNHQSMFDIPLLYYAFRPKTPRYISKVELAKGIPTISRYLRHTGAAIIERDNPRQALPEIKALAKRATQGAFGIAMFPEGTRARQGVLKKFKPTGLKILFANAPDAMILPVAIDGSWKFTCYKKGPIPLGVKVSVWAGTPIERGEKSSEELVEECRVQVQELLRQIRIEHGS